MTEGKSISKMEPDLIFLPKVSFKTCQMFTKLVMVFGRFIYFEDPVYYFLLAIFVIFTFLFDIFEETPYIEILGPPVSGKSRLGKLLAGLCFKAFISDEMSDASLYREIAEKKGELTLLIDELDSPSAVVRRVLRSGYRRNGIVTRCGPRGTIEKFPTFCPKVVISEGGIGDSALKSRCITIHMIKSECSLEKFKFSKVKKEFKELQDLIRSFCDDYRDLISDRYSSFTSIDGISGRDEEVWGPLIILADLLASLLDKPSIRDDILALAKKTILQQQKTQLIGNRNGQILEATFAHIRQTPPLKINGLPYFVGEDLCKSIKDGWGITNLKLDTVTRVLNHFKIIKDVQRPHLKKGSNGSEVEVQRSCYLIDEERLAKLARKYF